MKNIVFLKTKKVQINKKFIYTYLLKLIFIVKFFLKKKKERFLKKNKQKLTLCINSLFLLKSAYKLNVYFKNKHFIFFIVIKFLFFNQLQNRFSYWLTIRSLFKKTILFFRLFYWDSKIFKNFFFKKLRFFFNRNLSKKRNYRLIWKKKRRFFKKYNKRLWIKFKRFFKLRQTKSAPVLFDMFLYPQFLQKFAFRFVDAHYPAVLKYLLLTNKITLTQNYRKYVRRYLWYYSFNEEFLETLILKFMLKKKKRKKKKLKKFYKYFYINFFVWESLKLLYINFKFIKLNFIKWSKQVLKWQNVFNNLPNNQNTNLNFFKKNSLFFKKKLNYLNFLFNLKFFNIRKKHKIIRFNYYRFKKKRKSKKKFLRFFKKRKLLVFIKKKKKKNLKFFFKKISFQITNFKWFSRYYFTFSFKSYIFVLLYQTFSVLKFKKKVHNWMNKIENFFKNVKQFFYIKKFWPNVLLFSEVLTWNEYKYFSDQKMLIEDRKLLSPTVFLKQYLFGFLEKFLNKKIFFRLKLRMFRSRYILRRCIKLFFKNRRMRRVIGRGFFLGEFIDILWYSFKKKDLTALMRWVTRTMKRLRIKKHKKFISFFKSFLIKNKFFFLRLNKIKGFKFDIRGKVGVTGNAKKRHIMFSFGKLSFSKKRTRLDYQQGLVLTNTGVLGVTMLLFY